MELSLKGEDSWGSTYVFLFNNNDWLFFCVKQIIEICWAENICRHLLISIILLPYKYEIDEMKSKLNMS